METIQYHIVDVFAEKKFEGNPLAVFMCDDFPSDKEMLHIAKEINYSEITFVLANRQNYESFHVRIFTPEGEIPFAGHPTLGTAYIIQREFIKQRVDSITIRVEAGHIPVSVTYNNDQIDMLWMKQLNPSFGNYFEPQVIADVLNIRVNDLDERFPVQEVSTGLPTLIVPLKNLTAVRNCSINRPKYFDLVEKIDAKLIHVFSPECYEDGHHLNARNFGDYYGISEEPATGSATGCMAAYVAKHRYFGSSDVDLKIEQGYELKRPALLYAQAREVDDKYMDILVGGRVVDVAQGTFF